MYRHPALKQLKEQQARFAPRERRLEQIDRAELLLAEAAAGKRYPYEYLCFRITGFRPEGFPALVLEGDDVSNDLRLFVEDLSATVGQKVEQVAEPVLTVDGVSRRYNVSTRTVKRWRSQGLVARRFIIDGRAKVGFLESSVKRFVAAHKEQVERGTRFRQLSDAERDEIVRRARRLAPVGRQGGLSRSPGGSQGKWNGRRRRSGLTLKTYDREHPDRAIFPGGDRAARRDRQGQDPQALRRRPGGLGRGPGGPFRPDQVEHLPRHQRDAGAADPGDKLESMSHPSFDDPAQHAEILAPLPEPADGQAPRRTKAPKGLPPYLASLYEVPLLSREQEAHLFRKMNYLKHQANELRDDHRPDQGQDAELDGVERLQEEALAVKNQIIRANLRLVVSIAKRHVGPSNNFFELVCDGNMSLIRAVEKFDYARGNKFRHVCLLGDHEELRADHPRGELSPRPVRHRPRGDVRGRRRQPGRRARVRERPEAYPGRRQGDARPARRPRASDPHQPLRPRRRRRADARRARPRTRDHQGARPPDRVPRPGQAPQDRRRGKLDLPML